MTASDRAQHYRLHAEICKVLTEPKRLALLDALRLGELPVGQLAGLVGISLPNASQHLGVMRSAGLVEARRDGTTVRYRLVEPAIIEACGVIDRIIERRISAGRIAPLTGPGAAVPALTRKAAPSPSTASPAGPGA